MKYEVIHRFYSILLNIWIFFKKDRLDDEFEIFESTNFEFNFILFKLGISILFGLEGDKR